jgi:hypothetical protein
MALFRFSLFRRAMLLGLVFAVSSTFAQGPLAPPDAPAPTMKSLAQIESRTDVATLAGDSLNEHIISQPGSYYLTGNIDVAKTNGIEIRSSGVTLDLNGFQLYRSSADPATGVAIRIFGLFTALRNIVIKNGQVTGGVTYDDSPRLVDQFPGPGFNYGIAGSGDPLNVRVSHVQVTGCKLGGIDLNALTAGGSNTVEHCAIETVGGIGIRAGEIIHCTAITCGGTALEAKGSVFASHGESVGTDADGINASHNVSDSYGTARGTGSGADGIVSGGNVLNSYGTAFGGGIGIDATGNVSNSYGSSLDASGGEGILAGRSVHNSQGLAFGASGIDCQGNVAHSYGASFLAAFDGSTEDGISALGNIIGCWGRSQIGNGLYAEGSVADSYGFNIGSTIVAAIEALGNVSNSYGRSTNGTGIAAKNISNSYGVSESATTGIITQSGLFADTTVTASYGEAIGGVGILTEGSVLNSFGRSVNKNGIIGRQVMNSYGFSEDEVGLVGKVVSNCRGVTFDGPSGLSGDLTHNSISVDN